jgi:hypothetical protein
MSLSKEHRRSEAQPFLDCAAAVFMEDSFEPTAYRCSLPSKTRVIAQPLSNVAPVEANIRFNLEMRLTSKGPRNRRGQVKLSAWRRSRDSQRFPMIRDSPVDPVPLPCGRM